MKLLRELASLLLGALAIMLVVWSAGALVGLFVLGYSMVAP